MVSMHGIFVAWKNTRIFGRQGEGSCDRCVLCRKEVKQVNKLGYFPAQVDIDLGILSCKTNVNGAKQRRFSMHKPNFI